MSQVQFGGAENPQRLLARLGRIKLALGQEGLTPEKRTQLQAALVSQQEKIAALRDELSAALAD